jgi:cold shock protein
MTGVLTHSQERGNRPEEVSACHYALRMMRLIIRPGLPGMEQEIHVVREKGVVKWFNAAKGYGFIQRSSGEDVFVHFSAVQMSGYRTLEEGSEVEFEVKTGPKGLQAENVNRP